MDSNELRKQLSGLGLSQVEFATLIGVSIRTVVSWTGGSAIPGPVEAYLNLLSGLPKPLQAQELSRIARMNSSASEGLYSFAFDGRAGHGIGCIVAQDGRLFGSDGAVSYDGAYQAEGDRLNLTLTCSIPAGVELVLGGPAHPYAHSFDMAMAVNARGTSVVTVETPFGPVNARVAYLRGLPARVA